MKTRYSPTTVRCFDADVNDLIERFEYLSTWERANVLFRLAPKLAALVKRAGAAYVAVARAEDKVESI